MKIFAATPSEVDKKYLSGINSSRPMIVGQPGMMGGLGC